MTILLRLMQAGVVGVVVFAVVYFILWLIAIGEGYP